MCGRRIHESYFQQSDYNDATCECDYYDALVARGSSVAGDVLSRKNRETKDRVPNRKIATGGRVRCPAPSGAAVTLLIDACKPRLGAPPPSLVAALQLWAWITALYTVFSEGAARHFCLVGGALRRYISGRGGAPDRRRPHGGRWRSSRRAEVRQHQVAGAHFEGRALVRHTQSVREETGAEARLDAGAGVPGAREARLVRGCHLKAPPPPFAPQRAAKLS